jgi:hypothetical protein
MTLSDHLKRFQHCKAKYSKEITLVSEAMASKAISVKAAGKIMHQIVMHMAFADGHLKVFTPMLKGFEHKNCDQVWRALRRLFPELKLKRVKRHNFYAGMMNCWIRDSFLCRSQFWNGVSARSTSSEFLNAEYLSPPISADHHNGNVETPTNTHFSG